MQATPPVVFMILLRYVSDNITMHLFFFFSYEFLSVFLFMIICAFYTGMSDSFKQPTISFSEPQFHKSLIAVVETVTIRFRTANSDIFCGVFRGVPVNI